MPFGFQAFNNDSEVLISSSTKNLFFLCKAKYSNVLSTENYCGGNTVLVYLVVSPQIPLPFFSIPYTDRYVSLIKIVNISGNTWEIHLLVSGTSPPSNPEVYIFIEFDKALSVYGKHGMIVYKDNSNSDITFDSRAKPLAIKAAIDITPPTNPYTRTDYQMATGAGVLGSNLGYLESPGQYAINGTANLFNDKLKPDNSSSYNISTISVIKPIFNYSSIAQAYKSYYLRDNWSYTSYADLDFGQWFPNYTTQIFWNNFATFSRPGIKFSISGTSLTIILGWTVITAAQYNTADSGASSTSKTFAPNTSSQGTGGAYGIWTPSQSLNIRATVATIADGSRYD